MKIISTLLTCIVVGSVSLGGSVLSASWAPCDSDQMDYHPWQDSLHFCEQRINDELRWRGSLAKGLDVAVYNLNPSHLSGHEAVSSRLFTNVSHTNDSRPSVALHAKSASEQNGQSIKSKTNAKNNEIMDPADRRTIDQLGEPQNLPAPLVAAIIALIGVVAVARRKIM